MNPSSFFKEINSWQDFIGATARLENIKGRGGLGGKSFLVKSRHIILLYVLQTAVVRFHPLARA